MYQILNGSGIQYSADTQPVGLPTSQVGTWNKYYSEILGIVNQPQQLFTRSGANLTLNPAGTPMFDKSTINFYNLYVTDSWHIKPTSHLDLRSRLSGGDAAGRAERQAGGIGGRFRPSDQFHQLLRNQVGTRRCKGQVYNPIIGFSTIGNVTGASHKYPYNPFYGGVSPRVAVAWNPKYGNGILGQSCWATARP